MVTTSRELRDKQLCAQTQEFCLVQVNSKAASLATLTLASERAHLKPSRSDEFNAARQENCRAM